MTVYRRKDQWGDTWRYRKWVTLPDGTRTRIAGTPDINTKKAAEEAERAHVERLLNPPAPKVERRLMSDVFDRFLEEHTTEAENRASEKAAKRGAIERHLRPALGKLYLDEVTPEVLSALATKLSKTAKARRGDGMLGAKTRKNILQTLRKCLRWAAGMKWIAEAELPKVKMPKVATTTFRYLEDAELAALLETASTEPMWFAAIVLAADAGLRQGELRALKWTDINEVTGKVMIERSRWRNTEGPTKSGKPRPVPMSKRLQAALHAARGTRLRGPYVLSRQDGKPFGAEYMNEAITRLVRNAKLTDCTWHVLRHTFCTRLAMRGVPAKTIQELAGHASLITTMRYMHVAKGATDAAIAMLDDGVGTVRARESADLENDPETGEVIQLKS